MSPVKSNFAEPHPNLEGLLKPRKHTSSIKNVIQQQVPNRSFVKRLCISQIVKEANRIFSQTPPFNYRLHKSQQTFKRNLVPSK